VLFMCTECTSLLGDTCVARARTHGALGLVEERQRVKKKKKGLG
jgi:hypothetical protein